MRTHVLTKLCQIFNRTTQRLAPDTKIFFIGPNKTATVSFHIFMRAHHIRSVHWTETGGPEAPKVALEIERRLSDNQALKNYMSRWTAFSDLNAVASGKRVDGNRHFRQFDQLFPNSYFILNDRNTDDWIRSRMAHWDGALLRNTAARSGVNEADVLDIWRAEKELHCKEVLAYFRGRERFLHFRIDADPPQLIARFLAPRFLVNPRRWPHANRTIRPPKL